MATATKEKPEAAKAKTTTAKDIPERIVKLAGHYKDALKIDSTGVGDGKALAEVFAKHLPKGMSMESVQMHRQHDRDTSAALRLAVGETGIPVLGENPKLKQISAEFNDGAGARFGVVINRERKMPDGKGGERIVYGHSRSYFDTDADKLSMTNINSHLAQMTKEFISQ